MYVCVCCVCVCVGGCVCCVWMCVCVYGCVLRVCFVCVCVRRSELSKTVATFIIQKILLDDMGLK